MKNKTLRISLAFALVLSLIFGSAVVAYAAPVRNDESVALTYANGVIKCLIKWNYIIENKVHNYEIRVWKDSEGQAVSSEEVTLRRDSNKGRIVYTFVPIGSGVYYFDIYLVNIYGGTMNYPDTSYSITIP